MTAKRAGMVVVAVLALAALGWVFLVPPVAPTSGAASDVVRAPAAVPAPRLGGRVVPTPAPVYQGTRSLRGRVTGAAIGSGAVVLAMLRAAPEARDACPCEEECGRASAECACDVVEAGREARLEALRQASVPVARAGVAPDGSFELELAAGIYDLWAELPPGQVGVRVGIASDAGQVEIAVGPAGPLAGEVLGADGAAAAGARVSARLLEGGQRLFEATADAAGRFSLGLVPRGRVRVLARLGELTGAEVIVGDGTLKVGLAAPSTLGGTVRSGEALAPGARVRLEAPDCHAEQVVGADARFSFPRLRSGGHLLVATLGEETAAEGRALAPGKSDEEVVLRLGGACAASGLVRDPAGQPIAGAEVSFWLRAPSRLVGLGMPVVKREVTTGADGRYALGSLAAGAYTVRATAPGFAPSAVLPRSLVAGGREVVDFTLKAGAALSGRVVDPSGAGVADAEIAAERPRGAFPVDREAFRASLLQPRRITARSGPDGAFTVEGLDEGAYLLGAAKAGFAPASQAVQAPASGLVLALETSGGLVGRVLDARGGVAQASVTAQRVTATGEPEGPRLGPVTADDQGRYRLVDLLEGAYRVEARSRAEVSRPVPGEPLRRGRAEGQVRRGQEASLDVVLGAGLTLSGVVVDGAGKPLAGANLAARTESGERREFQFATSEVDGSFVVEGLEAGRYRLSASAKGFTETTLEAQAGASGLRLVLAGLAQLRGRVVDAQGQALGRFEVDGEVVVDPEGRFALPIRRTQERSVSFRAEGFAPAQRVFSLQEGKDQDAGEVVLGEGRLVTGSVVEDAGGAPLAGAQVRLATPGRAAPFDRGLPGVETGSDGRFSLRVEAGPVTLRAEHEGFASATAEVAAGDASVILRLRKGGAIRGRVLDGAGKGMPAHLLLHSPTTQRMADVGRDGAFVLTGLAAGTYRLTALPKSKGVGARLSQEVEVPEGGEVQVELRERTGGATLLVTVEPKLSCVAVLLGEGRGAEPYTGSGSSGVVTVRAVAPGAYQLVVRCLDAKKQGQRRIEVTDAPVQAFEVKVE